MEEYDIPNEKSVPVVDCKSAVVGYVRLGRPKAAPHLSVDVLTA